MPLESKIPFVRGPEGSYNFSRQKLGKKLWIASREGDFNLGDPNCYDFKIEYDPLHDENLRVFFSKPENIQPLIKGGLITEKLDAKCSLKEYNNYRKLLRNVHCDSVRKRLKEQFGVLDEERALKYTDEQAQKEVERIKKREKFEKLFEKKIREEKLKLEEKIKNDAEKEEKIKQRLKNLQESKALELAKRKEKRFLLAKHIKEKLQAAERQKRQMIIKTFVNWRKKEERRLRMNKLRAQEADESKRAAIAQKWKNRVEFQKKQIEKEKFLLNCIDKRKKKFLDAYNKKVQNERKKMKELLRQSKKALKCYYARQLLKNKDTICCTKFIEKDERKDKLSKLPCAIPPYPRYSRAYGNKLKEMFPKMTISDKQEILELRHKVSEQEKLIEKMNKLKAEQMREAEIANIEKLRPRTKSEELRLQKKVKKQKRAI
ncbi:golgin subfamily A member 6-like protein 1 [Prorops nasuta]|uniref:golgin subfamily A member 6-like protein 1 n=1 Tax=Prorops nasuta TaxID=863751 RepID=UPI0034CD67DF